MPSPEAAIPSTIETKGCRAVANVPPQSRYVLLGLAGIAVLSTLLYGAGITSIYGLRAGLATPHTTWPPLVGFSLVAGLRHGAVYGLLILGYVAALRLARCVPVGAMLSSSVLIVCAWLVFAASLLRSYPGDSLDIFDYVFRGRMQALFGASPLAVTPDAFQSQPFYSYLTWSSWVDAYGPIWEYTSLLVARVVGRGKAPDLAAYIIGYRILAIGLTTISAGILSMIVVRRDRQFVPGALVAWLWNPVLVISMAVGAHNDAVMIALLLLCVLAFQRGRFTTGLFALGMAGHVKVTVWVLVPVFLVWLVRRYGLKTMVWAAARALAGGLPVSWLLYQRYGGWGTLPRMVRERAILTYNSLANVVFDQLRLQAHVDETPARQLVIRGATLAFVVIAVLLLVGLWRRLRKDSDDGVLWRTGRAVLVAYLIVGCFWFQTWYVVWVLAVAALLPTDGFTQTVLPLFSAGALWSNVLTDFLNQDPARHFTGPQIDVLMMVALLAPPLAAVAIEQAWKRRPIGLVGRGARVKQVTPAE